MKNLNLNLQIVCMNRNSIPKRKDFILWLKTIYKEKKFIEITIRIVDKPEIHNLNYLYRKKNKPTNILSFSYFNKNKKNKSCFLGDLIACTEIIEEEAKIQKKSINSHWAHIIIHGGLHLLGFNHLKYNERKKMENLETKCLLSLGFEKPYNINQ
ncbi:Endoribonuclease YbeY [Buchnera aphidicola (Tetraneura ulmi)]|uniref:rRNA maturation RNase YbeY n=1 Tax=Buchnera aphidicola TaxID=9 RepID=UPI00346444E5